MRRTGLIGWRHKMANKIRLLVVDDDQEILAGLKQFLSDKNYDVITATDGLDALLGIEADKEGFDLVITDVVMPNISGIGITTLIRQRQPTIPVIAITGMGEQPESLAKEADADVVLVKPFDLPELRQWIERLLENKPLKGNHR